MNKPYKLSLFIFRRDLRLDDNTALNLALEKSEKVIPCFIFDPQQIDANKNDYYSANAVQFMIESLQQLATNLTHYKSKLYLFYGKPKTTIQEIIDEKKIDALFFNTDYTPFSIKRDSTIEKICSKNNVAFYTCADALLNAPDTVLKKDRSPYSIFGAFYKNAKNIPVQKPQKLKSHNFFTETINSSTPQSIYKKILPHMNKNIPYYALVLPPTHKAYTVASYFAKATKDLRKAMVHKPKDMAEGLKATLKSLINFKNYAHERDYPALETTHLSAHLKFGTISVRQAYYAITQHLKAHHPLLRQLYWRDFFTHIAYHFPHVFGHPFHKKYEQLPWNNDKQLFTLWCTGQTGFPIVDAGMRELNATGYMHNRVRMIVASFLTKDLHIDWKKGEKYFAQQLVDYDPAVNNGNWQWCASTGCDAQPYFRIFNPWLQQKKFDLECLYIKKWVPELKDYEPKIIHNLYKTNSPIIKNYLRPIVDHQKESALAKALYKKCK